MEKMSWVRITQCHKCGKKLEGWYYEQGGELVESDEVHMEYVAKVLDIRCDDCFSVEEIMENME